ncbi:hypothetical protein [Streptosporangium sp. NPDC001681]|uniref:hypothetical protein n=1 Tax=Streptosporangium sp. NPDC001681 TaxID=3154395 RepID=UPI00332B29D8
MTVGEIIFAIGGGLLVNECCDLSPWAARKVVIWSARLRYGKSDRADIRVEEHAALIDTRPGKLFKLVTALAFACGATAVRTQRTMLLARLYLHVTGNEPTNGTPNKAVTLVYLSSQGSATECTIKERREILVVSTQLSVGVDLGPVDHIFTHVTPADNLLQLPGRVNRRFNG